MILDDKTILITGGTGSFGRCFARHALTHYNPKKIIIYSRDEFKQWVMANDFAEYKDRLRFFIGDVRDYERMKRAFEGVDYVIHAAALKQVPACEYNPNEAIKTNVNGAQNVIDAALNTGVQKVVALSTDKAVNPVNLYGGTKLVSDKLFIAANAYCGTKDLNFSIVRYGNVAGSRGSIIPLFQKLIYEGVREIPSFKITDLAEAMAPGMRTVEVGIRPGEKLHEVMITAEDSITTYEYDKNYIIYPQMFWQESKRPNPSGRKVEDGFYYSSGNNREWLTVDQIKELLKTDLHE